MTGLPRLASNGEPESINALKVTSLESKTLKNNLTCYKLDYWELQVLHAV